MKTTLDLDDALLIEAKIAAARRRTTLKAMVEHALRRELAPMGPDATASFALPVLPKRPRPRESERRVASIAL